VGQKESLKRVAASDERRLGSQAATLVGSNQSALGGRTEKVNGEGGTIPQGTRKAKKESAGGDQGKIMGVTTDRNWGRQKKGLGGSRHKVIRKAIRGRKHGSGGNSRPP